MNDRVMHVKGGTNVKLENLTVQNGHTAANYGGAIYNLGELEIDGCVVTGSYGNSGGNIANIGGGTLLIQDSTVSHGDALVYGGGIVNYAGGTLVIEASVIENNYANDDGGGILNNNESTLSITDSIISNNEALDNAGGISNADEASAEIYNSTVTNNIAGVDAGGIQNGGSSTFTIEASIISNNSAGDDAGGIYNGGVDAYLHLLDSEMTGNFAANDGGGFMHTNNSSMLIEDSLIGDNEAGSDGGAALIYSDNITITSVIFSGNIAQARGGAIYNSAAEVSVGESSLYLNEAQQGGGAIYNAPGGEIALETLSITDNTSGLDGCGFGSGAIHNTDLMEIDQSLIANNSSSYSGGGIFNKSTGDLDIANTTIYGNEVTDKNSYGGGVYSYTGGTVNISACTITENTAPSGAGGIYGDATGVNIINTIVSGNTVSSLVENCNTDLASSGYNLEDRDTCGFDATGDQTNTRPIFDSAGLADNGGSTHTIALGTSLFRNSSPAINAGLCEDIDGNTITVDQRNYFRDNVCDIGAYEVQ